MSKETMTAKIPVQWAIRGKEPRGTKYKILDCSDGALGADDFAEIMTRYPVGAQGDARAVSVSRFGHGHAAHLGLSIQDETGGVDWVGRRAVETRYYVVSFGHLRQVPVSYEGMYRTFESLPLPSGGMFVTRFPALDHDEIARTVTPHMMRTSALLMTNKRVCVVGAQSASIEDRLRYVDNVASLLPYGMRPQFTASTWASSTGDHKFRLYFADESRGDGYTVDWFQETEFPRDAELAHWYFSLIRRQEPHWSALVERLSRAPQEISFEQPDRFAITSIVEGDIRAIAPSAASTVPVSSPRPQTVAEILLDLGEPLVCQDRGRVEVLLRQLENVPGTTEEGRSRYQGIIKEKALLAPDLVTDQGIAVRLYRALLRIAFAPDLRPDDLPRIEELAGRPLHPDLSGVLGDQSASIRLVLAKSLDRDAMTATMMELPPAELVRLAEKWPVPPKTFEAICDYLCTLPEEELRTILPGCGFLVPALQRAFPKNTQRQYELFVALLSAARMDLGRLDKVFSDIFREAPLWGVLQAALTRFYGPASLAVLTELTITGPIQSAGLKPRTREEANDNLYAKHGESVSPHPHPHRRRRLRRPRLPRGWSEQRGADPPENSSTAVDRDPPHADQPGPPVAFGRLKEEQRPAELGLTFFLVWILIGVAIVVLIFGMALVLRR